MFSIIFKFAAGVCSSSSNNAKRRDCATPTQKSATTRLHPFFIAAGKNFLDLIQICKIITLDSVAAFCCVVYSAAGFHGECIIIFSGWGENPTGTSTCSVQAGFAATPPTILKAVTVQPRLSKLLPPVCTHSSVPPGRIFYTSSGFVK